MSRDVISQDALMVPPRAVSCLVMRTEGQSIAPQIRSIHLLEMNRDTKADRLVLAEFTHGALSLFSLVLCSLHCNKSVSLILARIFKRPFG